MHSNEDADTAVTLDDAVDHHPSSSPKRKQRVTFKRAEVRPSIFESPLVDPDEKEQTRFWSRPMLIALAKIAIPALFLPRHMWLLQGIAFVVIAYIALVVYKWVIYIVRNEDLKRATREMTSYFTLAMREAEKTIEGGMARRTLEGGALACRGTAQSFTIWFIRLRNEALLQQNKRELETVNQRLEQYRKNWGSIREKIRMSF
jgi:uncharacterized membrane protein YqjE